MKTGIAVAGTILVDNINEIAAYPASGELTKIIGLQKSVGGCVPNVSVDLARIAPSLTVKAVGRIGEDENGEFLLGLLRDNRVDTTHVKRTKERTSFTEVMSVKGGQRTFFTYAGASASFGVADVALDTLDVKMLHLGYFLLLDRIDGGEGEELLKLAKEKGITTSIDLVSENSDRYALVERCLPYVDNLIINETEAARLCGVPEETADLPALAKKLKAMGVCDRVILHTPDLGLCCSARGLTLLPSYDLPDGYVKGTTGAGDAFCAGALVGIHENMSDAEILDVATVSAAASLSCADAIGGLKACAEMREQCKNFKRKQLC